MYVADDTNVDWYVFKWRKAHTKSSWLPDLNASFRYHLLHTTPKNISATIADVLRFQANHLGADLFGGPLDRCTINSYSKTIKYSSIQGFEVTSFSVAVVVEKQ